MPRYLLLLNESEEAYTADPELSLERVMAMHKDFQAEVVARGGTVLAGEALEPVATATFLRNTRSDRVVAVDNPSPDVKEALGGFYLIEARDAAHARELAELCPAPAGHIELRPAWDIPS